MNSSLEQIEFGQIADFRNGLNFGKTSHGVGCLLIGIPDFKDRFLPDYKSLGQINPIGIAKDDDYLQEGDILFVRSNGNKDLVGRSLFIDKKIKALYSGFCIRARLTNELITPLFCAYYTRTDFFKSQISSSGGTNIQNLNQEILSKVKLPLFPLKEQGKITQILSTLDAKIDLNNRINAELEQMAKTLYDYWFVQFDFPTPSPSGRAGVGLPYKSSGGKMVWCPELKREVPEGWEVGNLLDIADFTNGLACQKFRPINDDYLRVIKIREMHDGFSKDSELVRSNIPSKVIVENGDVLFSWSASLEVMIWANGRGALNQHIFKVTSSKFPKSFYFYQLFNYLQHFKMMADNRKTTMGHITQEHLQQSRIVIPPHAMTLQLEKIIAPLFQKLITNKIENQHLSSLRDWLLPMLMNGQVKVGETRGYTVGEERLGMVAEPKTNRL